MTNEARPSSPGFTGNQLNLPSQEYSEVDRPHSQGKIYTQGTLTEGDRRLSTVNLQIKQACFVTMVNNIFNKESW
jgi:hypothetical protein